jgi:magnesium transporter
MKCVEVKMQKYSVLRSQKTGLAPGTLMHIGHKKIEKIDISIIEYNEGHFVERKPDSLDDYLISNDIGVITWINIDGLHNTGILEKMGERFKLHPLVLEDMLNTEQRPKIEDYGDYIYIVAKMLHYNINTHSIVIEQQNLVLGNNFVLSIGEIYDNLFGAVRERLRNSGRIRKMGSDYLAYSLLDIIVDNYFTVLDKLGDRIEWAEEMLIAKPTPDNLRIINDLKRDMLYMHKSIRPLREVAGFLERGESPLIQDSTRLYIRDVYDHLIQTMDTAETYRDILSGMLDIYLSSLSNKMNEIMKVLTIISTIFIPLTFIAGVYGMNFKNMPELEWHWGYFYVLLVMVAAAVSMLIFFRRKRWL